MDRKGLTIPVLYEEFDEHGTTTFKKTLKLHLAFREEPPVLNVLLPNTPIEQTLGIERSLTIDLKPLGIRLPKDFKLD